MKTLIFAAVALALATPATLAQTPGAKRLRLVGEAPAASDPAPKAFVIDALVAPGDGEATTTLTGWLAATLAPPASGEVTGTCVEQRCALTADLDGAKFTLTGDFGAAAGPVAARFALKDEDKKTTQAGAAALRPLAGPVANLGALAEPGAVTEAQLDDLLVWAHESVSSGSPPGDDPPTSSQRESLAVWQNEKGRLATGLIFASDLAQLSSDEAAARKAAGWTALGDAAHGWSAGYPAALLPKASRGAGPAGPEQRFASADGNAVLVVAFDAPMTGDQFDAFVDKVSADRDNRDQVSVTRVNGDLEMRYREAGVITVAAYHNRDACLARLVFSYPDSAAARYEPYETILQRGLVERR
jgi:hypothetical protein